MLTEKKTSHDHITSDELHRFRVARDVLELAREDVRALSAALDYQEKELIERIELGATCDEEVEILTRRRQNISWLTAFKERLGTEAVVQVKNDWPMTFYKELQLS